MKKCAVGCIAGVVEVIWMVEIVRIGAVEPWSWKDGCVCASYSMRCQT